jgi:hypothetical protein
LVAFCAGGIFQYGAYHPRFVCFHRIIPVVTDATGEPLGTIPELDMSSGNSLATAGEVWSTCLHFDGSYTDADGRKQSLNVTESYGLRVRMYGPLAAADVALGLPRPMTEVSRGRGMRGAWLQARG